MINLSLYYQAVPLSAIPLSLFSHSSSSLKPIPVQCTLQPLKMTNDHCLITWSSFDLEYEAHEYEVLPDKLTTTLLEAGYHLLDSSGFIPTRLRLLSLVSLPEIFLHSLPVPLFLVFLIYSSQNLLRLNSWDFSFIHSHFYFKNLI